jgi:hypothetical protein
MTIEMHKKYVHTSVLAFLGVLGAFAVKVLFRIYRQDAKSAKNFAKQKSF